MAYEYTRENNLWEDTCYLITKQKTYDENGVEKEVLTNKKEVFCLVGGIYMKEFYEAQASGIKAQYKIVVSLIDYDNETVVEYRDETYSVYRKYPSDDKMELYLRSDIGEWE